MARYKPIDTSPRLIAVDLERQLLPGTFEHALNHLIDRELDLSSFDARYRNDLTGASAWPPAMLLKIVLFAYSQGIVSSRGIERSCREQVTFIALSGDSAPHHTTIAAFVSGLGDDIAKLFAQVLWLCERQGLIGREMFAIDGVKLPSNASKGKSGKRPSNERVPLQIATAVNEVWSMDFVSDSLVNGRRIKCLTVADDFSHECVDIAADFGISGQYVTRLLDQAATFRGYPKAVRTDNGPEFTSRAFMGWAQTHGIRHLLIQPGKPMQNGYIESFNGKFRDECLNEHWFETLSQARAAIAAWRKDYNEVRPHSSCRRMPPAQYAALHRQHADDAMQTITDSINLAAGLPAE